MKHRTARISEESYQALKSKKKETGASFRFLIDWMVATLINNKKEKK
jgi:hypothetical protein